MRMICIAVFFLLLAGFLLLALTPRTKSVNLNDLGLYLFSTWFLASVLSLSACLIPYLIFYLMASRSRREEFDRLESAMSMITNAYAGHYNILAAVEHYILESNKGVPSALREKTPFDTFLSDVTIVGYSVERSLVILETQVGNPYFSNWVKALRQCSQNRNMLFALQPVIQSMSDHKNMLAEAASQTESTWRDYLTAVFVALGLTPMFRVLNADWYNIMTKTVGGNILLFLLIVSCLVSAFLVARISRQD